MTNPSPPGLENILSSSAVRHKHHAEARAAAQAKERETLLAQYPAFRRRRESETWLLPQLIYHWALTVVEQRPVEWSAGRKYWSARSGFSVTTTSQNYGALERDGLITREQPGPKGWNGWQPCIVRPAPPLLAAVFQKARKIRSERQRAQAYARKKHRLSLTPDRGENSGVSDNLGRKTPRREDSLPFGNRGQQVAATVFQIPLRHPPPEPPG